MSVIGWQVGWPSLIATSRTPRVWPRPSVGRFRDRVRIHFKSGQPAGTDGFQPKSAWVGLGLGTLVMVTTGVVGWVSIWWVPAYLALMVLIFVTPSRLSHSQPTANLGEVSADVSATSLARNLRINSGTQGECIHLGDAWTLGLLAGELSAESADHRTDFATSAMSKPRRNRGRARKVAKMAADPLPESAPAMWIRVGPGKFVRADVDINAFDQAYAEARLTEPHPTVDAAADTIAPALAVEQEQLSVGPLDLTLEGRGIAVASVDLVERTVAEEHGIAPSTFGLIRQVLTADDDLENDGLGDVSEPRTDYLPVTDLDVDASWRATGPKYRGLQGRISRSDFSWVSRRLSAAIPYLDGASSRRNARNGARPRTVSRSSFAPNMCFQQAARRAFGRLPHIQRVLRPRSPPDCQSLE
jgi:hypothetical protein